MPLPDPPRRRTQKRNVRVTFRATQEEAEQLQRAAERRDVGMSWLIRKWLRMGERMEDAANGDKTAVA